jgi:hypothetical protein
MPPLGPLVILVLALLAAAFRTNPARAPEPEPARSEPARSEPAAPAARLAPVGVDPLAPEPAPAPVPPPPPAERREPVHARVAGGDLYLPSTFASGADGAFDLVVHFHGIPSRTETAAEHAELGAALLTINLGLFSGPYEKGMSAPGSLDRLVRAAESQVSRSLGTTAHATRVALSAWSAGYGAVAAILGRPAEAARVDAVLLADGLHTSWVGRHQVDPARMAPFVAFASRAKRGDALLALTHSAIRPGAYASTTDTARFLTDAVGVPREIVDLAGPRSMHLREEADAGDLHVRGFDGADAPAQCDHLIAIGDTLFPWLRERWSRRPAAIGGGPKL